MGQLDVKSFKLNYYSKTTSISCGSIPRFSMHSFAAGTIKSEVAPVLTVPRRAGQEQIERARIHLQRELERLNASTLVRLKQRGQPASVIAQCVGNRRD